MWRWTHMLVGLVAVILCLFPTKPSNGVDLVERSPDWYESCRHRIAREEIVYPVVVYLAETECGLGRAARGEADRHRKQQGLPDAIAMRYTEEDRAYMRDAYPEKIPSPVYLGYFVLHEDETAQFVQKSEYPLAQLEVNIQNGEILENPWENPWLWVNKANMLCIRGGGPEHLFFREWNWGVTRITFGVPPQDDYVPVFDPFEEHRAEDLLDACLHAPPFRPEEWMNILPGMGFGEGIRHVTIP